MAQNEHFEVLDGVVEGLTAFGAFVKLPDGRRGMVHISEIANTFVKDIQAFLAVGDTVRVVILEDTGDRIRMSIRQALAQEERERAASQSRFEDIISKYMKQSEERQLDVKRNLRKKCGAGNKRR